MEAQTDGFWVLPSEPVAELIRDVAGAMLEDPSPLADVIDAAVLAAAPQGVVGDPALAESLRVANHANLSHWLEANRRAPGARVPANVGPEVLDLARDIVRRGFDDASLNSYRIGQNAAWRFMMSRAFSLTSDFGVLEELLDLVSRSIFTFVDDTVNAIAEQIDRERDELTRGTHAERLEAVNLILEGAPISAERAAVRLGYQLAGAQLAAVIWSEGPTEQGALEVGANALARAAGASRPFTVVAGARSLWVWLPVSRLPDTDAPSAVLPSEPAGIRAALGSGGEGIDGFRRSHLDALATQRVMQRMPSELRLAAYEDIELIAIAASDDQLAADFVTRTLGELAGADAVLRETLRVYISEQFNTSAAARALFAHRNTILGRIERASALLPGSLEGRGLEIGLALEIQHWLGLGIATD